MTRTLALDWHHDQIPDVDGPPSSSIPGPEENGELGEFPPILWDDDSSISSISSGVYMQRAVLPVDSVLEDWFEYARQHTEGADCYLAGSMIPIVGALLGRRIWIQLGGMHKYPNVFALICGKPGDRKSTTIRLAASLARRCLPETAFIPATFSPESLFDEYDESCSGRPDKLWIADDANAILTDWQKTQNGERNATRFLELYDCAQLSESFRRNKKESEDGEAKRMVAETSTNVVFGATFNVACFQGQTVRAGMARRFLYYTAERRGCDIYDSPEHDPAVVNALLEMLARCGQIEGQMRFTPEAYVHWIQYQETNREQMDMHSPLTEDVISRLASAPAQVLAVAMIFEAAMWAKRGGEWSGAVSFEALDDAMTHVDACLEAARWMDGLANRFSIAENAEVIFARILDDFDHNRRGETIYASRTELTRAYCHNSHRRGALTPHELYTRLIPALIHQGKARLALKDGKREVYAFRVEE